MIRALVLGPAARMVAVELTRRAVRTRGLAPYLRRLAAAGKPMEGISAGAILLGRSGVRFPERGAPEVFACLGVVPASFDTRGEADGWSELRELPRRTRDGAVVYGIPSHAAASWDGALLRALGAPLTRFRCGPRARRLADAATAVDRVDVRVERGTIARGNPLSYIVDALRHFMVGGGSIGLALDFGVMIGALAVLIAIAARLYPTLVR